MGKVEALLLDWHGRRTGEGGFVAAGAVIEGAVAEAIKAGECTRDLGGRLGTQEAATALAERLRRTERP